MKYLYSWIKEYYPNLPPLGETSDYLIQLGHEVEQVEPLPLPGIVIAEIKNITRHPDADNLSLVVIFDGSSQHRVVCGAPNLYVGQKVVYAPVNSILPSGMMIRSATIRDERSDGMLCAEDELGLGLDHTRLLSPPEAAKIGQSLDSVFDTDAIFYLAVTSNRGDILSHFGLARDLSALIDKKLLKPAFKTPQFAGDSKQFLSLGFVIDDVRALYFAVAQAEKTPATPLWMATRLNRLGYKSINFATDITNYLLLAYGQPLHVYGQNTLSEPITLGVRRARSGERFEALNHQSYQLSAQDLVVTNRDEPIGLAGTIGGEKSKASVTSSRLIFEGAEFHSESIGAMTRSHNLFSESAGRFERGIDPEMTEKVLLHALALWQEYSGGKLYTPISVKRVGKKTISAVPLSIDSVNRFLGTSFDKTTIKSILTGLGCRITEKNDRFLIEPPSWRFDLAVKEDYYEELLRSVPISSLPEADLPASVPQWKRSRYWRWEWLKDVLAQLGAYEVRTYPFLSDEQKTVHRYQMELPRLKIPPQSGKTLLRPEMLPGMLEAIAANPETSFIIFFEIGTVFSLKSETSHIIIATAGGGGDESDNFWRNFFERLHLPVSSWMARVQTVESGVRDAYKIRKSNISYLELPLEAIPTTKIGDIPPVTIPSIDIITYAPLGKYQASHRDIAFIVSSTHPLESIAQAIADFHPLVVAAELFDTYTDPKLGKNVTSYAFHIVYQSPDKTLTSDEINQLHAKLERHIKEKFNAIIR